MRHNPNITAERIADAIVRKARLDDVDLNPNDVDDRVRSIVDELGYDRDSLSPRQQHEVLVAYGQGTTSENQES